MTILRKPEYSIAGKWVRIPSNYSNRTNQFYINVPAPICETMNQLTVTSEASLNDVESRFRELLEAYSKKAKTRRAVIFYTFKSKVRPLNFISEAPVGAGYGQTRTIREDETDTRGVGIDLWFLHGYEETDPITLRRSYLNLEMKLIGDNFSSDRWKVMGYTEERLSFFIKFREYLKEGIERMQAFFSPANDIPALIDAAVKTNALPFLSEPTEGDEESERMNVESEFLNREEK